MKLLKAYNKSPLMTISQEGPEDMMCDAYACSGRKNDEHGSNLANQACHWKDGMISVEIDIKITGIGCTVCKWQAKQE